MSLEMCLLVEDKGRKWMRHQERCACPQRPEILRVCDQIAGSGGVESFLERI